MVESGVERLADGIHTEPGLQAGKSYELKLVCAGHGTARLRFRPTGDRASAEVPCDQSVVAERISGDKRTHIDVDAVQGATGVVAWEVDSV
ncbi:hypothetical protein GCM10010503_56540 [Streptomyces lucensis JCM 4490]|uniref:Uncharacterized protein n=2 Tax=Streptomyces lucensis TaxID=67319 RepID=A0A918JB51_9ACTN|nr:hypothetical protein GCM10010503_56540 [Streptomyces lucensis JCM 4490]